MLLKPLEMPMECHRLGNAILKPRQPPQALFTMNIKRTIAPFSRRFSVKTPVTVERVYRTLRKLPAALAHSARSPFISPD